MRINDKFSTLFQTQNLLIKEKNITQKIVGVTKLKPRKVPRLLSPFQALWFWIWPIQVLIKRAKGIQVSNDVKRILLTYFYILYSKEPALQHGFNAAIDKLIRVFEISSETCIK